MLHLYHLHLSKKDKIKESIIIDSLAYFFGILSPFFLIPQLYIIWVEKNAKGISEFSFAGFAFVNLIFVLYGYTHKNKLIIINNVLWGLLQALVVIGTILYK